MIFSALLVKNYLTKLKEMTCKDIGIIWSTNVKIPFSYQLWHMRKFFRKLKILAPKRLVGQMELDLKLLNHVQN